MGKITITDLTNDIIMGIYDGLSRNDDLNPIYFDAYNLDVGSYVSGYFSSNIKDQEKANRELMHKIMNGMPKDDIDDPRYILINQIYFSEFIEEFLLMAENKEPYVSFVKEFCDEIEERSGFDSTEIEATYNLQKKFATKLMSKYKDNRELIGNFPNIFNYTTTNLSVNWAIQNLGIDEAIKLKRSGRTWNT